MCVGYGVVFDESGAVRCLRLCAGAVEESRMKVALEISVKMRNEALIYALRHGLEVNRRGGLKTSDAIMMCLKAFLAEHGEYHE